MVATLYGELGVDPDADEQTIVRAYRRKSKAHHPDVSDDPDAAERFKRLTTAKEVLTDETERFRYDRIGHEAYVRGHLDGWGKDTGTDSGGARRAAQQYAARRENRSNSTANSSYWSGSSEPRAKTAQRQRQTRGGSTAYGTAASYYRPGQRVNPTQPTGLQSVWRAVQQVGPWLLVNIALVVSAVAMAVVLITGGVLGEVPPVVGGILASSLIAFALFVSTTHVVSQVAS